MMTNAAQRTVCRCLHLVLSIPILGYCYSPFQNLPQYAPPVRFVFFPAIVLTGLWMWKGHRVMALLSKRAS